MMPGHRPSPRGLLGAAGLILGLAGAVALPLAPALGFCGFYVAQADSKLFNKASKVVLAWDAGRASITMASDYEGDPKDFALVIPVPTPVERQDVALVKADLLDKLDGYSAPRLTEYYDGDPCRPVVAMAVPAPAGALMVRAPRRDLHDLGVTIEARYEVGVYDVLILSAKQSDGLTTWLAENGYRTPAGAGPVLGSYIGQGMHFFVAKVNLARHGLSRDGFLSPLQVSYRSNRFTLPIRLGTVNARGPQDLVAMVLTRRGRVETANYQTAMMPSGMKIPLYAKGEFGAVYKAAFDKRVRDDGMRKVYMEYAWDMRGFVPCDPCAAPVPTAADLFALGARWHYPAFAAATPDELGVARLPPAAPDAFITRLHVRYDGEHFPEDLALIETADRSPFQAIYKLTHPATAGGCEAGRAYAEALPARFAAEARNLAALTGWSAASIHARMGETGQPF